MIKEKYEWEEEIIKLFKKDFYKAVVLADLASIILDTYNKNYNKKNKTLKDYRRQSTVDLYMEELLQLITKAFNVEYKKQTKPKLDYGYTWYTINTTPKL
jgi:hypothetical protein